MKYKVKKVGEINKIALTIDVEDGLSLAMRDVFGKHKPQTDRVYRTTREILNVMAERGVKGTFFTLGMVAKDYPQLIREIVREGHELAVHGYSHYRVFNLTKQEFFNELRRAKNILEEVSGEKIIGHRAPAFSISKHTPWAFEVLAELGFEYDSSVMPIASEYHGIKGFPKSMAEIVTSKGGLIEFPITTTMMFRKAIPFSGGTYLRLLPLKFLENLFLKETAKNPSVLYFHPYEFDREPYPEEYFKLMREISLISQLKLRSNFINRSKSIEKFNALLSSFEFDTMKNIVAGNPVTQKWSMTSHEH